MCKIFRQTKYVSPKVWRIRQRQRWKTRACIGRRANAFKRRKRYTAFPANWAARWIFNNWASAALEAVGRLADFDMGEVSLIRESDGDSRTLVMTGSPDGTPGDITLPRGIGIMGWVIEHGRTVRVGDVMIDPRYHSLSSHIMSEICLPLRVGERIIGVLI